MEPNPKTVEITKEHLQRFPIYIIRIQRSCRKIAEINLKIDGFRATDYSKDRVSGTPTEDLTINLLTEKMQLEESKRRLNNICMDILASLETLQEKQKLMVNERYISGPIKNGYRSWLVIARSLNFDESWCRKVGKKGIEEISPIFESVI